MPQNIQTTLFNGSGGSLVRGQVVRSSSNKNCTTALATSSAGVQGVIGVVGSGSVGIGGPTQVTVSGQELVLLETGLTPSAGQTLYISASAAGRATNVTPSTFATPIGVIEDTSLYSITGLVLAIIGSVGSSIASSTTVTVDTVNTSGVMLTALQSGGYTAGTFAFVQGNVSDYFKLQLGSLPVDDITCVNALGKPGYQWVRALIANPSNALVTTWSVDPANSNASDENDGLTDATALKSIQEVKRRLWLLPVNILVTVRVLSDASSTDTGIWIIAFGPSGFIDFTGTLGPVTGPGGVVHDNTLYSGSITSISVPANGPQVDEYTMTDTAIPVSFTASGLLAPGVIFKRTNSTLRYWFAVKDNGSKTIRQSNPMNNTGSATWTANTVGDTYIAYQLIKIPPQNFGAWSINVLYDLCHDNTTGVVQAEVGYGAAQRRHCYFSGASKFVITGPGPLVNCCFNVTSGTGFWLSAGSLSTLPSWNGGAFIGTGSNVVNINNGKFGMTGTWVSQGLGFNGVDSAYVTLESQAGIYDCSTIWFQGKGAVQFVFQASGGAGISGKGNTGAMVNVVQQSSFGYCFAGATPPFNAGSTSDATPIGIGASSYSVANMPAAQETVLIPSTFKNSLP